MLLDTKRQHRQVIASFQYRNNTPPGVFVRRLHDPGRHPPVKSGAEVDVAQGVVPVGVEPCGDDDEFRLEAVYRRQDLFQKGCFIVPIAAAGAHGAVHGGAPASAGARFRPGAGAGIEGILVGADEQHRRVFLEGVLRTVAVVYVPVQDHDLVQAVARLQVARQDGHVVEDAEPHGLLLLGMVPGRTHQREAVADFSVDHAVRQCDRGSGRLEGDVEGCFAHRGVHAVEKGAPANAGLPGPGQVGGGMAGLDEFLLRRQRIEVFQFAVPGQGVQVCHRGAEAFRTLRMPGAGPVRQEYLVKDESGGQCLSTVISGTFQYTVVFQIGYFFSILSR